MALRQALASPASKVRAGSDRAERVPDRLLPVYTVLVPVFREANVLPGLIQSLRALDYPPAKLEIFIVLEAIDIETQAAVLQPGAARQFPLAGRARRRAADQAQGAELRAAVRARRFRRGLRRRGPAAARSAAPRVGVFRRAPPGLACLQAQLNIYNPRQSWFTRQFTIEYSVLFDAILPALEKLRLPVPLGGTSNHFPRATLLEIGALGPVQRDGGCRPRRAHRAAGLPDGRAGLDDLGGGAARVPRVADAAHALAQGLDADLSGAHPPAATAQQRARAARGDRLSRADGRVIGSALVHPVFYALLAYYWLSGSLLEPAETIAGSVLWTIALINLRLRLWRVDPGRRHQRGAAAPGGPGAVGAADADLLAAHLVRRLSRRLAARPRSVPVGEDRARPG